MNVTLNSFQINLECDYFFKLVIEIYNEDAITHFNKFVEYHGITDNFILDVIHYFNIRKIEYGLRPDGSCNLIQKAICNVFIWATKTILKHRAWMENYK